jgi:hypothetical protein
MRITHQISKMKKTGNNKLLEVNLQIIFIEKPIVSDRTKII